MASLSTYSYLIRDARDQRRGRTGEARNCTALRCAKRASRRILRRAGRAELRMALEE